MPSIHLREAGGGHAIVIFHGVPTSPTHMEAFADALANTHRTFVVHAPGYGDSAALRPYSLAAVAELVESSLSAHGVREAALIGFSAGAYTAFLIAFRRKLKATHIMTLGGVAGFLPDAKAGLVPFVHLLRSGQRVPPGLMTKRVLSEPFSERNAGACADVERWIDACPPDVLADELQAAIDSEDLTPRMCELDVPIVVRVGELDVACPVAVSERVAVNSKHAKLEIVAGAGHALLHEDLAGSIASARRLLAS
jgi:pimeloyl-ACP methyl ester carboxylesterase